MTPDQIESYRNLLVALQNELLGKGPHRIEPNRTSDEVVGEKEDEQPLNEMLNAIASNRNRSAAATLKLIEKALKKIKDDPDDFGMCEDCGDELLEGRLKAMPYTELCVDCRAKADKLKTSKPTRRNLLDFS